MHRQSVSCLSILLDLVGLIVQLAVRMEKTFRILATWNIFGGMKVIRFLSTVIVLAIVPDDEGTQRVVSYGLKVSTKRSLRTS